MYINVHSLTWYFVYLLLILSLTRVSHTCSLAFSFYLSLPLPFPLTLLNRNCCFLYLLTIFQYQTCFLSNLLFPSLSLSHSLIYEYILFIKTISETKKNIRQFAMTRCEYWPPVYICWSLKINKWKHRGKGIIKNKMQKLWYDLNDSGRVHG